MQKGKIVKATGGFYYVDIGNKVIECRARGIFRKENVSPYVGDNVEISITGEGYGSVDNILPRKNCLVRPPLANLDYMVVVISTTDPLPNYVTIDKYLATLEAENIPAVLAITKLDLKLSNDIADIYKKAGYKVFEIEANKESLNSLRSELLGKLCAFSGNSGVGKSSLINLLDDNLDIEVGVTSKKLGRGKHTTRHVEIYKLNCGLEIVDTPGFSSLDLVQTGAINTESLSEYFIDFEKFAGNCKFRNCKHLKETGCAVIQAVENGDIPQSRYSSYVTIYNEIKDVKEWERR